LMSVRWRRGPLTSYPAADDSTDRSMTASAASHIEADRRFTSSPATRSSSSATSLRSPKPSRRSPKQTSCSTASLSLSIAPSRACSYLCNPPKAASADRRAACPPTGGCLKVRPGR
jgi:hypothetical protein